MRLAPYPQPLLRQRDAETVEFAGRILPCLTGRNGFIPAEDKVEGDGKTPTGFWRFTAVYYRPDRLSRPKTILPVYEITPELGWSDDPQDPRYNQPVIIPHPYRHENVWRQDHAYDLIIVTDHNRDPVTPGRGSAVFIHCLAQDPELPFAASAAGQSTAGCLALHRDQITEIVRTATAGAAWDTRLI